MTEGSAEFTHGKEKDMGRSHRGYVWRWLGRRPGYRWWEVIGRIERPADESALGGAIVGVYFLWLAVLLINC